MGNKALDSLEKVELELFEFETRTQHYEEEINTIKQALITKSKKEQAFDIIKNKNVDIYCIKVCIDVEHYNSVIKSKNFNNNYSYEIWYELTQEEFDILKEML